MNLIHILAVPTGIPSFSVSLDEYCSGIKKSLGAASSHNPPTSYTNILPLVTNGTVDTVL